MTQLASVSRYKNRISKLVNEALKTEHEGFQLIRLKPHRRRGLFYVDVGIMDQKNINVLSDVPPQPSPTERRQDLSLDKRIARNVRSKLSDYFEQVFGPLATDHWKWLDTTVDAAGTYLDIKFVKLTLDKPWKQKPTQHFKL